MHTDFWSIFTSFALLLQVIPGLVVISLALETEKKQQLEAKLRKITSPACINFKCQTYKYIEAHDRAHILTIQKLYISQQQLEFSARAIC